MESFELESYLSGGVEKIVKGMVKTSLSNPRQSVFMLKYVNAAKKAKQLRLSSEERGEHIPPFLIASITSQCNLFCKGCYARANHSCEGKESQTELPREKWGSIFSEAFEMGIGFILLAGGEPLMRRDIIEEAGLHKEILFPIFTNGTMLDEEYRKLFSKNRNLIPVLSIEGHKERTDERRGSGVHQALTESMDALKQDRIMFGVSITVTKENMAEVTSDGFTQTLEGMGCHAVIYVEYVPADETSKELAPDEADRLFMEKRLAVLRERESNMLYIAFPGDEKSSGGCLAAGRGFFHINASGGAEPCPFSPYSDTNLRDTGLRGALQSPLFRALQSEEVLLKEHVGGCVLFEQRQKVSDLAGRQDDR